MNRYTVMKKYYEYTIFINYEKTYSIIKIMKKNDDGNIIKNAHNYFNLKTIRYTKRRHEDVLDIYIII